MDGGLGEIKKQSQPPGISKGGSSLNPAITKTTPSSELGISKTTPSSKLGISKTTPSSNSTQQPPSINSIKSSKHGILSKYVSVNDVNMESDTRPADKNTNIQKAKKKFDMARQPFTPISILNKVEEEVDSAESEANLPAKKVAINFMGWAMKVFNYVIKLGTSGMGYARVAIPQKIEELLDEVQNDSKQKNSENKKPMIGGGRKLSDIFKLQYIPGSFSLLAFIFLIIFLLWVIIMWLLNKFLGDKYTLPNVKFNKKTTQIVYSIFFAITSLFLMFYLFIDYFRILGPELDIVQIFKQCIGGFYILWPMAILIIGSGIAKAFYKISCNGNKPNVLSWAKIVESSALYILGICVLFTVIFLFKPVNVIYNKILPSIFRRFFDKARVSVAVTLKLMVIYILLRMITIMLEDIISNKIVFFISKLNKDVVAPPVDCNAEEEEKNAKQSEIANILEEIYMYISGIIVCIIIVFIMIIQSPHPYIASVYKINDNVGSVFLKVSDLSTKYILENGANKKDCNEKSKGSGFFSLPAISTSGRGAIVSNKIQNYLDSLADMKDADIELEDLKRGRAAEDARALAQASREKAPAQSTTTTPDNSSSGKGKTLKELFAESAANKAREAEDIARTPTSKAPALNPEKQLEQIPKLSLENQLKQIPDTEPIKIDII